MRYKRRKNSLSLSDYGRKLYVQHSDDRLELRLSSELKAHATAVAQGLGMSRTELILAALVKEIGLPKSNTHTFLKESDI